MTAHDVDLDALLDNDDLTGMPERIERVCLAGKLAAKMQTAEAELLTLTKGGTQVPDATLASPSRLRMRQLAEEIEDLREQMRAAEVPVLLRGLNRMERDKLAAKHPPRKDHGEVLFNADSIGVPLLEACIVTIAGKKPTSGQLARFLEKAAAGDLDRLGQAASELCWGRVSVPFSLIGSAALTVTDENSRPPEPSVSPDAGSSGGNRAARRRTSTTRKGASSGR